MRIAAQVLLAYFLLLVLGAVWRLLGLDWAAPDVVALCAAYLGLTARTVLVGQVAMRLAPPTLGAVVMGYLGDLLSGTPRGLLAFTAGAACIVGHLVQQRLLVRGRLITIWFSFFTGLFAGLIVLCLRAGFGLVPGGAGAALASLLASAALTGVAGLPVFRLCRVVDARFARTQRERDATLGGVVQ